MGLSFHGPTPVARSCDDFGRGSDGDRTDPWRAAAPVRGRRRTLGGAPSRRKAEPPIDGELPASLDIVLGNQVYIERASPPPALVNRLVRLAAFQNPEFYAAQALRLPTFGKPRVISCAELFSKHVVLPRGCLDEALGLLAELSIRAAWAPDRCSRRWPPSGKLAIGVWDTKPLEAPSSTSSHCRYRFARKRRRLTLAPCLHIDNMLCCAAGAFMSQ